jgi:cytosine/adenosine deaminase-related metal-dependent hydrolase
MHRYSANYVCTVSQPPIKNGIVEVDETGVVLNVINPGKEFKEIHSTEFFNGVIVPGFVNAHCHLELSHLFNKFSRGLELPDLLKRSRSNGLYSRVLF